MLTIFRRHLRDCRHTSRRYRRCQCPLHVEGSLRGEKVRRALDLTSWEAASDLVTQWNASGMIGMIKVEIPTVDEAVAKFFEDVAARGLKPPTVGKLKNLLVKRLRPWCESRGFRLLKQLDVDEIRTFRATWPDGPISAHKNIERLRSFFSFCLEAGWIQKNPAKSLKPPKVERHEERVRVFTADDIAKIMAACEMYPARNSRGQENRGRIRPFMLALRYTGLRIGDVVGLKKASLQDGRIFLGTQKTGAKVYVPVPDALVAALGQVGSTAGTPTSGMTRPRDDLRGRSPRSIPCCTPSNSSRRLTMRSAYSCIPRPGRLSTTFNTGRSASLRTTAISRYRSRCCHCLTNRSP